MTTLFLGLQITRADIRPQVKRPFNLATQLIAKTIAETGGKCTPHPPSTQCTIQKFKKKKKKPTKKPRVLDIKIVIISGGNPHD